ncbi:MAG: BUG/TctC family periplasmic protein, partial [uncultured Acetobacteraceae bacterium]
CLGACRAAPQRWRPPRSPLDRPRRGDRPWPLAPSSARGGRPRSRRRGPRSRSASLCPSLPAAPSTSWRAWSRKAWTSGRDSPSSSRTGPAPGPRSAAAPWPRRRPTATRGPCPTWRATPSRRRSTATCATIRSPTSRISGSSRRTPRPACPTRPSPPAASRTWCGWRRAKGRADGGGAAQPRALPRRRPRH